MKKIAEKLFYFFIYMSTGNNLDLDRCTHCLDMIFPLSLSLRCVHVGDTDVRHQAISRCKEQRCDWANRERRAPGHAPQLSPDPLQSNDQVLGL